MSWRERSRWEEPRYGDRGRSPVWEGPRRDVCSPRGSPDRRRDFRDRTDRRDRDRHDGERDRHDGDRDRHDGDRDRHRRERYDDRRDRDRERERRRSPRRSNDRERDRDIPAAPSPPTISNEATNFDNRSKDIDAPGRGSRRSRSESKELDRTDADYDNYEKHDEVSPGDWYCKCGSYNFKRRLVCYRRNCQEKRPEGIVYGSDGERLNIDANAGITKRLLFRRLDALTTEEKILEAIKGRCSKSILDSIAGITIGRETLTGASKCLAFINFNSIADSTSAHSELLSLNPPLEIDNREVLISFYNEPQKMPKNVNSTPDYGNHGNYYGQMSTYNNSQALSEADRVNAAAAVAQSAIFAAQARNLSWTPVAAPTFVGTTAQTSILNIPTGDGKTKYPSPDTRTFLYDESSGYYYDPATGLYYDGKTQYFFNNQTNQYLYWDTSTSTYIAATQSQQNTEQPKLPNPPQATVENTITKEPEEKKKKDKEDKVKVAKKIAKDMERWARTLNQKKEIAKSNIVLEQPSDMGPSKGSADIGFSVLGAAPTPSLPQTLGQVHMREISPPPLGDDFLMKKSVETIPSDNDEGIIDWAKLTCLLCKRRFPSADVLNKHKTMSDLHKQNLLEFRKKSELMPQPNGYRDRAAERRMKFGEVDEPILRKRYEHTEVVMPSMPSAPAPSVVDTIGGKMLQKMGWSEGRGLGKTEQGRIAPIEAEQRPALAGLGQKKGIYTPTPGETYRDTVKKLMIARYKEVINQEDN